MSYLYYSIYKLTLFTSSKNDQPEHTANIILALILSFTLFGIINILEYFGIKLIEDFWKNKILFVVIYLGFIFLGYYIFIRKNNYISLVQKFDIESKKNRIRNVFLIFLYLILLIILNFMIN